MLRISTRSRYAVRILICLGSHEGEKPVQRSVIQESEGISVDYAVQILTNLRRAGMVESIRGKEGGYVLAVSPEDITVLDIVNMIEGEVTLVDCEGEKCRRISECAVKPVWDRAAKAASAELGRVTLKDLVEESHRLKRQNSLMFEI